MTVSSTNTKNSYSGDGSVTVFAYTFKIFDDDDITVIIRTDATGTETVQTKNTHYSVSGVGDAGGGNITFVTAPAVGETVVLLRETSRTQDTDYTPNDPFPADSHEDALDKLTFIAQEIEEELSRAIKISKTNSITTTEFTIGADDRANKVFAFDNSGDFAVTQELGIFRGDWTSGTSFSVRDLIKDTSNNNIYICQTAHTSSGSLPISTNINANDWELIVDAATATSSATAAAASATAAAASETAAAASETAAAASETAAAASETAAATSETNAASSASAASTSATNAATSETNAAASATSAASSATSATSSATSAATSATTATTKASEASTSATNAATSASSASSSATAASTSASNAATSETNAASSASAASTSASSAASSATSAASSAAAAAAAFDNFDDTYLGAYASNPTVDNDGDALTTGDLYFNTTANEMRVYDGAQWIAASAATQASLILYEYTATSGQTTFSGADDNAATLAYTADNIQVVMNGVILDPSDYTATNGTSVVLASGAATGDLLNIYAFQSFSVADTVSASAGGTFSANVSWGDNNKAIFGAGSDLQIWHSGSHSYIVDQGTGNLYLQGSSNIRFQDPSNVTHMNIADNGDISFYDSTGTTQGFFWDASAQNLGIGTTSPNAPLEVVGGATTMRLHRDNASGGGGIDFYNNTQQVANINAGSGTLTFSADPTSGAAGSYVSFETDGSERMRIDSSGNVGIGMSSPFGPLHVNGGVAGPSTSGNMADVGLIVSNGTGGRAIQIGTDSTDSFNFIQSAYVNGANVGNDLAFYIGATERMRVDSSGNVGIGTTNPDSKLFTIGDSGSWVYKCFSAGSGAQNLIAFNLSSGGSAVGSITSNGSSTSYNTTSDHRLKENVTEVTGAADRVKALNPVRFNFIADPDTTVDGFLAHEVADVVPEAVTGTKDAVDDEGNALYQGIDQSKLVPLLTAALQEALTKIDDLESRLSALETAQ